MTMPVHRPMKTAFCVCQKLVRSVVKTVYVFIVADKRWTALGSTCDTWSVDGELGIGARFDGRSNYCLSWVP